MNSLLRVGYLGPQGTFSQEAARAMFPPEAAEFLPYRTIPEILASVEQGRLDFGVVPIENSIEGSVAVTLDVLVHEVAVAIAGELVLPVTHHLMVREETKLEEVESVLSHPQALAQCRKNLEAILPRAAHVAATSTAEAAQQVAASEAPLAALGTKLAAELYGLKIVRSNMQDLQANATRFVKVGLRPAERTGFDKTSIVFAFGEDRPGNLYRALKVFADRSVNLTKLESRPAKRSLGDYIFFIDMEGHLDDPEIRSALEELQTLTSFFKLLGSYPRVEYKRLNGNGSATS